MVSGMQTGSPTQKIIAMVPRGSQKTACLNYPPGHKNDPRHPTVSGTLSKPEPSLIFPASYSGRFQRPAGTEATRVARCEGRRTDERNVGVRDGAVHSSILPLSGFANPFPAPLPGGRHRPFFTLQDGAGVLASPSKSADFGTAPRISSAWRRAGRYRAQHAACRRLRSRRFRAACPP